MPSATVGDAELEGKSEVDCQSGKASLARSANTWPSSVLTYRMPATTASCMGAGALTGSVRDQSGDPSLAPKASTLTVMVSLSKVSVQRKTAPSATIVDVSPTFPPS